MGKANFMAANEKAKTSTTPKKMLDVRVFPMQLSLWNSTKVVNPGYQNDPTTVSDNSHSNIACSLAARGPLQA